MLFNSQIFLLLFLPFVVAVYYVIPAQKYRIWFLILASLSFYAYWDYRFLPLLFISVLINWCASIIYMRSKAVLIIYAGVLLNLIIIGVFKYFDFFSSSLSHFFDYVPHSYSIILPLGISFFTFQQISYLIDLKRGQGKVYRFDEYILFVTFFPQLIAGPIVRHNEIISQFWKSPFRPDLHENFTRGLVLTVLGLAKKVFFADEYGIFIDEGVVVMLAEDSISAATAWLFALSYTLQLYFDFSAYSDMAIGLGAMFGFTLPRNFKTPYVSRNLSEFWKRWHITLSRFFRDYLYIPFGGSWNGYGRYLVAVLATMTLCGLWHGADWSFVAWGFLHGCGLAIYFTWKKSGIHLPFLIAWLLTFLFVVNGWVLFRLEDFSQAKEVLLAMYGFNFESALSIFSDNTFFIIIGLILSIFGPNNHQLAYKKMKNTKFWVYPIALLLAISVVWVGGEREIKFIYFQF